MACEQSQGVFSRMVIAPYSETQDYTGGTRMEFVAENMSSRQRIVGSGRGISGTRSRHSERGRLGALQVYGTVVMNVDPAQLDVLLP